MGYLVPARPFSSPRCRWQETAFSAASLQPLHLRGRVARPPHCPRLPSRGCWGQRLFSPGGGGGPCRSVPRMGSGSCCTWVAAAGSGLTAALAPGSERTARARDGPTAAGQSSPVTAELRLGARMTAASRTQSRSVWRLCPAAPRHRVMTRQGPSPASWKLALGFTVAVPSGRWRCGGPHCHLVPACCHVTPESDPHARVHRAPLG